MKENIPLKKLQNWHRTNFENRVHGRYITFQMIEPLLQELSDFCSLVHLGNSVQNRPIHAIHIGHGSRRVLMWSQMHGNESTTTKAIFDLLLAFQDQAGAQLHPLLEQLSICIVPLLNPDGAQAYTRNNANDIDLNRDAQVLSQPESIILRELFETFKPDVCFNLHGQRTIYGFEATGNPSILSFLSPSADGKRSITLSRKRSMSIITAIYDTLQRELSGQIGRYDDGFNLNCVGDTFQHQEVPTVLFEAGHAPNDYEREQSRQYVFLALISGLQAVCADKEHSTSRYFEIPEHQKCYCDVLIHNTQDGAVGIQYEERLAVKEIEFIPLLATNKGTKAIFGHKRVDAKGARIKITFNTKNDKASDILHISLDNGVTITL